MHSPCLLLFPTINFFLSVGFIHLSVPLWWKMYITIYIFIYQQRWTREDIWTLRSHWGEIKKQPEEARPGCCKMTDLPREVCTRSVTKVEVAGHTQLRASMAYLNSSSHTTWSEKGANDQRGFTRRRSYHVFSRKHIFSVFFAFWPEGEMQRILPPSQVWS